MRFWMRRRSSGSVMSVQSSDLVFDLDDEWCFLEPDEEEDDVDWCCLDGLEDILDDCPRRTRSQRPATIQSRMRRGRLADRER